MRGANIEKILDTEHYADRTSKIKLRTKWINGQMRFLLNYLKSWSYQILNNDFILMFGISDFDDEELEKQFVKRLNNPS